MRWRVERIGSPASCGAGWIAHDDLGRGALFDTQQDALAFARRRIDADATAQLEATGADATRARMKLKAHGQPVSDQLIRTALALRTNGHTWHTIADILEVDDG